MSDHYTVWDELHELLVRFEAEKAQIFVHYQNLVAATLEKEITSEREIEALMDGRLVFCDDEKFLALYKKLCRHVYYQYPQLVGEHVNLFRLQFEEITNN